MHSFSTWMRPVVDPGEESEPNRILNTQQQRKTSNKSQECWYQLILKLDVLWNCWNLTSKSKGTFFIFFWKMFFSKKKYCLHFRSWSCLLWANFFFLFVLSARARARARARAPSCKHGGALGALRKRKVNFSLFGARGRVRAGCEILQNSLFIKVQILGFRRGPRATFDFELKDHPSVG